MTTDTLMKIDELKSNEENNLVSTKVLYELLIAIIITVILIWLGYYLVKPSTLPIRQVRIEGDFRYLSTNTLQELVRKKVRGGFFSVNVNAIRDVVLTEPWVRDVSVHRIWPDGVQVFVTEQVAVVTWKNTGLLNRSGELFTPDQSSYPKDLAVLNGPDGSQKLMMDKFLSLQNLLSDEKYIIRTFNLDERGSWSIELNNGLQIVLGRKDFDIRITRFIELVPASLGEKLKDVEKIDMRYTNGFTVRWKKDVTEPGNTGGEL